MGDRTGVRVSSLLILFTLISIVIAIGGWKYLPFSKGESVLISVSLLVIGFGVFMAHSWTAMQWDRNQYKVHGYLKEPFDTSESNPIGRKLAPVMLAVGEFVAWIWIAADPSVVPASEHVTKIGLANAVVWQSLSSTVALWLIIKTRIRSVRFMLTLEVLCGLGSFIISGYLPWQPLVALFWELLQLIDAIAVWFGKLLGPGYVDVARFVIFGGLFLGIGGYVFGFLVGAIASRDEEV